jgi:hypothetical protein
MVKIEIVQSLLDEIERKFKKDSIVVLEHIKSLENNPQKGKNLGTVGGIVIKEIRFKGFRFYFIADGFKLKFFSKLEITSLLLRFVRMSDKKRQQKVVEEIKNILKKIGPEGF